MLPPPVIIKPLPLLSSSFCGRCSDLKWAKLTNLRQVIYYLVNSLPENVLERSNELQFFLTALSLDIHRVIGYH